MKLQRLTINNIASIEHAVIDFGASPLADERLFLITGETGSGKSTIIDCLCLALYGGTPRLNVRTKVSYDSNHDKGLTVTDSRQLMRRGSVKADIELSFESGGIPYVATWEVHRAYNRPDGNLSSVARTLMTADGFTPAVHMRKKDEINDFVEKLIGLNMDQFFRTVVLAQGKFAEFLTSTEKEKSDLLEKMTGTEIYTSVGKKIYQVYQSKANRCVILRGQMDNIVLLTDEQRTQLDDEKARCVQEHEMVKQRHDKAVKMAEWLDEMEKNERDTTQNSNLLEQRLSETKTDEYLAHQALISDWDSTAEARQHLTQQRTAASRLEVLREKAPALQDKYQRLCAALRATIADMDAKREKLNHVESMLRQEEPNKGMYDAIGQIKSLMTRLDKDRKDVNDYGDDLEKDQKKVPQVEAAAREARQTCQKHEAELKMLQEQYKALRVSDVDAAKDDLTNAGVALNALKVLHGAVAQAKESLEGYQNALNEETGTLSKLNATIEIKRVAEANAKQNVERQKDWNTLLVQAKRDLKTGDTCPICGNTIDKMLVPKGESELNELRQLHQEALKQLQQAEVDIKTAQGRISDFKKLITKSENTLKEKTDDLHNQWKVTRETLDKCGMMADEMPSQEQAEAMFAGIDGRLKALNEKLDEAGKLSQQVDAAQERYNNSYKAYHQANNDLFTLQESIKNQRLLIENLNTDMVLLTTELDGLFTFPDWKQRHADDNTFIERLVLAADDYRKLADERQQLSQFLKLRQTLVEAMENSKANIKGLDDSNMETGEIPENLSEQWRTLESDYLQWQASLKNEQENVERETRALNAFLAGRPDITTARLTELLQYQPEAIETLKDARKRLDEAISSLKGAAETLNRQRKEIAAKKPDFNEQDREKLDVIIEETAGKQEGLNNRIVELRAQLSSDEENRKRRGSRQQELEQAEAECEQWERFNKTLGNADGTTFRNIAQSYILGELLAIANGYLRQFNNHYELMAKSSSLVILVRDLIQGDVTSVNTLSGGESFMVSLALALALSNMTGKVFAVDTLFIDEGFGSLSENYLDNVMETLNRLYDMGGRRVGIISHVEMLKERVSTQIQVERAPFNNTVSRIRVTAAGE